MIICTLPGQIPSSYRDPCEDKGTPYVRPAYDEINNYYYEKGKYVNLCNYVELLACSFFLVPIFCKRQYFLLMTKFARNAKKENMNEDVSF